MVGRKNRKKLSFAKTPNFVHLMMCPSSSHLRSGKIDNPDFLCPTLEVALVGVLHRSDCHRADDLQEPWGRAGQSWHAQFNNGNRPKFQSTDPVAINADFSS